MVPFAIRLLASCWRQRSPRAPSAQGSVANTLCHRCRGTVVPHLAVCRPSLGISLVTKKSLHNFCAGRGGQYLQPSPLGQGGTSSCRPPSIARHHVGHEEVPAQLTRGLRRPIPSAIAVRVCLHLIFHSSVRRSASRWQERSPHANSARDTAANTLGLRRRGAVALHLAVCRPLIGILLATKNSPRAFCAGRGGLYLRFLLSGRGSTSSCHSTVRGSASR